ncbi:radical SAM/SPASM domain-containing protein [Eubacterium sp.]
MKWSVGIGTTNKCNLQCPHCYSRNKDFSELSYSDVENIINKLDVDAINFGTGENILNKDFLKILDLIHERGIKASLTSNGYTVMKLPSNYLEYFNDIDISLEFPTKEKQEKFRGEGAWDLAISAIEKCIDSQIDTSIACCMMNINVKDIIDFDNLLIKYGINLRINTYKPVNTSIYCLTYEEYWNGIKNILKRFKIVSCSEPILNAVLGIENNRYSCGCGKTSLRINPDGGVYPCVYWNKSEFTIKDLSLINENTFSKIDVIPNECKGCKYKDLCAGGCEGRRVYRDLHSADEYCPFVRGEKMEIEYQLGTKKDLVHSNYLCTLIVSM